MATGIDEISIGDRIIVKCLIKGREERCEASVVDKKRVDAPLSEEEFAQVMEQNERPGTSASAASRPQTSKKTLFYVHYNGMDRRLDEWVDQQRIVLGNDEQPTLTPISADIKEKLLTRSQRRIHEEFHHLQKSYDDMDAFTAKLEREHAERTKVKNIEIIEFADYEIYTWYFSPFPIKLSERSAKMYFCEFCMLYTQDQGTYDYHSKNECQQRRPPGEVVYEDFIQGIRIYEVEGAKEKSYCQCLCLLSKLFLDHKTLYYDVEGFIFYVLCEIDPIIDADHTVGHFSKEIDSANNLACIMVLPPFQRKGYGKLLIQLSYFMSERDDVIGTPEKPLSDLGRVSYRSFWCWVLFRKLGEAKVDNALISLKNLSLISRIHPDDITSTLTPLRLIKYWKGVHLVRVSKKVLEKLKHMGLYHPPKLLLNVDAVKYKPRPRPPKQPLKHQHHNTIGETFQRGRRGSNAIAQGAGSASAQRRQSGTGTGRRGRPPGTTGIKKRKNNPSLSSTEHQNHNNQSNHSPNSDAESVDIDIVGNNERNEKNQKQQKRGRKNKSVERTKEVVNGGEEEENLPDLPSNGFRREEMGKMTALPMDVDVENDSAYDDDFLFTKMDF